jgi:archaellum component FlaC
VLHQLENKLSDLAANLIGITVTANEKINRLRNRSEYDDELIEHLSQDINAWDDLYQWTRHRLVMQQESNRRLLAILTPLAETDPELAEKIKQAQS